MRAALASTVLKLRELVRRNREGDLSVPGFWPQALAALFWPVLLTLGLGVSAGLLMLLIRTFSVSPVIVVSADRSPLQLVVEQVSQGTDLIPEQAIGLSVVQAPSSPEPFALSKAAPLELDPLLVLLSKEDPDGCIASVRPHPEQGLLDLELTGNWADLPLHRRQQQADLWLQSSRNLGYEYLRLVTSRGQLLAQAARVGSGMVLLEPETIPQA
ncbi:MAG: hypothetical protein O2839_02845 [Cyanobacteria bacterium]|nr:hypothetical protein [Cyanobacteriota bacterium]MDA1246170.1 hypothetical protein [Cyanobacteriota bacterium]